MKRNLKIPRAAKLIASRLSSLLLLFQRSPIVQMLFPEAKLAGSAGLGELGKWTVATVAGLGAFDSVAGATTIAQVAPSAGSTTVPAKVGQNLNFIFQLTGYPDTPGSWKVSGLPDGLTHANVTNNTVDSVSGSPTKSGTFTVTITAYQKTGYSGDKFTRNFTMNVLPGNPVTLPQEIEVQQPAGVNLTDAVSARSFGSAKVGTKGRVSIFTVKNAGGLPLTGISVYKDGLHKQDFIITKPPVTSLAAGASTTFAVTFKPSAAGTRSAAIHVKSNDVNENPFDVRVSGVGAP